MEDHEATCWGCGLRLLLPSYSPIFKCGWCGAITKQSTWKPEKKWFFWRRLRDRCLISCLFLFMLFVICGGVWAVYPVIFSISHLCGILHSTITAMLSVATISLLSLAAFRCAGAPPSILWGSYPLVGKDDLENYTFCQYCSKPKSPRAHHCRSCGMCILDMDHHCPFIGNCVGAANHLSFVAFLIAAVVSMVYVMIMTAFAGIHLWPPSNHVSFGRLNNFKTSLPLGILKEITISLLNSAMLQSARGLILLYLFIASISVEIGLSVLLWQQLSYIYEGKTYLSELSSQANDEVKEGDCQNLVKFFSCPTFVSRYCPRLWTERKRRKIKGDI